MDPKVRRWLVASLVVGASGAAGYAAAAHWLFPAQPRAARSALVEVPDLVGRTATEARAVIEKLGLEYRERSEVNHPRAPEGAVLAQIPLPGQLAKPGAPVGVTLSRGPESYTLPDVAGLSARQAGIVLERLGFSPEVVRVPSSYNLDVAVGTRPGAGTRVDVPATVQLLVSSGPPVAEVPDLSGRHLDDVREVLTAAGLALGTVTFDPASFEAPGRVIGQYPPAGYSLRRGGLVDVRVAGNATSLDPGV